MLILSGDLALAQQGQFNMNIRNGLLSNHVYRIITDRYGFLWIATSKGVARYNGYTTKIFDASAGISNDDIWGLFEDQKGRIWLSSISNELGYIYRGAYHKVYIDDPGFIYPVDITDIKNGIAFISGDHKTLSNFCIEQNDSVKSYPIEAQPFVFLPNCGIAPNGDLITQYYNGDIFRTSMSKGSFFINKIGNYPGHVGRTSGKYFLPSNKKSSGDTQMTIINLNDGSKFKIPVLQEEQPRLSIKHQGYHYITTNRNVYKIDNNLKVEIQHFEEDRREIPAIFTTIVDDSLWGRCVTTENKGLYIKLPSYTFKKSKEDFATSVCVGTSADSCLYLWNEKDRRLMSVDKNKNTSSLILPGISQIKKIMPFSPGKSIMLTDKHLYEFSQKTYKSIFRSTNKLYKRVGDSLIYQDDFIRNKDKEIILTDCLITPDTTICAAEISYGYSLFSKTGDSVIYNNLDGDRYRGIVSHLPSKTYIAFGRNNIFVHRETTIFKVRKNALAQLGIKNIQKILVDNKYGNVLIHCNDKLFVYNITNNSFGLLFENYNLKNAYVLLYNDRVLAVGGFGVVSCNVSYNIRNATTSSLINFKNSSFNHVHDTYLIAGDLFLNTDVGLYEISLDDALKNDAFTDFVPPYKFFVSTVGYTEAVSSGDTVVLHQDQPSISFDFINPYGSGQLKYSYAVDGAMSSGRSLSEQIVVPVLKPGKYYTLSVIATDDIWKSKPYTFHLYMTPYWWQTDGGKWWIFFGAFAILIILSAIATITTRNILVKRHLKQSRYMELELKSIYAQLNPHFIFNTLGNIVYFVRQNRNTEAYRQLNVFSKLLRSYLKSSRNKWLSITEEADNLNNYILLQKSRFENKFDYIIDIDKNLDAANTYIPVLLLQPIVENAINHGLQQQTKQGNLSVKFKKGSESNTVVIIIDDDGIGRVKAKEQKNYINRKESYGTSLLDDLIAIYRHYELFKVNIEYIDKVSPMTGTSVIVTIKYNL